jgi:hypothetical protein
MGLQIGIGAGGDLGDGEPGSVGGHDGPRTAVRGHAFEKALLDFEIFGDGFDDPIGVGAPGEMIFKVAEGDAGRGGGAEKGGGAGFEGGFEAGAHDAIADARVGEGEAASALVRGKVGRNDVEEGAGQPGIGKMGGDARSHGAGSKNHDFFEMAFHVQGPQ